MTAPFKLPIDPLDGIDLLTLAVDDRLDKYHFRFPLRHHSTSLSFILTLIADWLLSLSRTAQLAKPHQDSYDYLLSI